ncbi:MAG: DUF4411 family protein [Spirochaetia bacterium]|jgi:hypothetical protein
MEYSVDTSSILDAWRRYYPPDVFPALWTSMDILIAGGSLRATDEVRVELERKDDEVLAWAAGRDGFFVELDDRIQMAVTNILSQYPKLLDTRSNRSGADPFVIALAQIENSAVVTGERLTNSLLRPNIPDVCRELGIRSMNILELIREQNWHF